MKATDILVNNLGIFEPKPFAQITDADWQRFFDTNVMSGVRVTRAYLPGMVAVGWGRVVFISSESGLNIPKEMIHYGMTKTAQLAISRGLAESVAGTGVTVNAVLPGPTLSEGVAAMLGSDDPEAAGRQFVKEYRPTSLIGRLATVEEVANMVVYACSPQASATSGAALRVDGGGRPRHRLAARCPHPTLFQRVGLLEISLFPLPLPLGERGVRASADRCRAGRPGARSPSASGDLLLTLGQR